MLSAGGGAVRGGRGRVGEVFCSPLEGPYFSSVEDGWGGKRV